MTDTKVSSSRERKIPGARSVLQQGLDALLPVENRSSQVSPSPLPELTYEISQVTLPGKTLWKRRDGRCVGRLESLPGAWLPGSFAFLCRREVTTAFLHFAKLELKAGSWT